MNYPDDPALNSQWVVVGGWDKPARDGFTIAFHDEATNKFMGIAYEVPEHIAEYIVKIHNEGLPK